MRSVIAPVALLPLLAAVALMWPRPGHAQAFSADYGLSRGTEATVGLDARARGALFNLRLVRIGPAFVASTRFSSRVLSVDGGYRWNDGQSLSLQLSGGRGTDGLGLAVSYDWPRYFVRLTYDTGLNPVPRDKLRLSAGMRF